MRQLARRLGQHLATEFGYRGAYGIDGVMTVEGFRVTELNPRLSGGMTRLGRAIPEAQLELVQLNALLGRDIGITAAAYEEKVTRLADQTRFVDAMAISKTLDSRSSFEVPVTVGVDRLEVAGADDDVIGAVTRGPSPMGTYIRLTTLPGVIALGDRAAPLSVLLHEFADRMWDTGFGELLMPPDVLR
jgi:hypothetical protein